MREVVIGIGAHPDDEVLFAGTLMKKKAEGAEVSLLLITDGQAGTNPYGVDSLGETRLEEWRGSAQAIGVEALEPLHYSDGELTKENVVELVNQICKIVLGRLATVNAPAMLSLITFDQDGLTGHTDHLVVTDAVIQAFERLATDLPPNISLGQLLLYRLTKEQANQGPGTEEYPLTGYSQDEIDLEINVSEFVTQKKHAMASHQSQENDMKAWTQLDDQLGIECFRIVEIRSTDQES